MSGLETAQAFWSLLIPHGFDGGALKRIETEDDDEEDDGDDDTDMDKAARTKAGVVDGWKKEYLQWWFDFLNERGDKGVTKDSWNMVCTFLNAPINVHDPPSPHYFYILTALSQVSCLHPPGQFLKL